VYAEEYVCPECGVAYDEQTRIWYSTVAGRIPRSAWSALIKGAVLFPVSLLVVYFMMHRSEELTMLLLLSIGAVVLGYRWAARRTARGTSRRPFVASTPKGLVVSLDGRLGSVDLTPWSTVRDRINASPARSSPVHLVLENFGVPVCIEDARELESELFRRLGDISRDEVPETDV